MTCAPELERTDGGNQNVKQKRCWSNNRGREAEQRHRRNITRRSGVTHGRVKKGNYAYGKKQKNEMCGVHVMMLCRVSPPKDIG